MNTNMSAKVLISAEEKVDGIENWKIEGGAYSKSGVVKIVWCDLFYRKFDKPDQKILSYL